MVSAPTRDLGTIDWRDVIGSQWWDASETVPDLTWPASVAMYGRMRHDPKLSAILKAYSLPIRRATWAIDPAGCRDEVVQVVADDIGLPILGADAEPGPARRRGVSWPEHLRLALLSLTYGHSIFERRYEIRNGLARLVNLGERMPWTISMIDLNPDGTIASVRQDIAVTQPIPATRLLWYSHDREGATWTGKSLLRPAYGPWLLKHELWRVNATSIRRFGMGVPNVEAPAGATPAQVTEAQRLASAMRVGDQAGVGLPAGFKLNITGMTGSAPDAMAMIHYLDQQMSTLALAGFLDLGQTATGSRALGESFIDLFMLSLQAVADELAAVATSGQPGMTGAVTDIVDLNWGEDEPAPRIVCTDVGQRHDLSAQGLMQLIQSGAITPDEELEAYLRETYNLPAPAPKPEPPAPPVAPPPPPAPPSQPGGPAQAPESPAPPTTPSGAPQAASATRRRRANRSQDIRAAGDPQAGHRQLTMVEAASGFDPEAVASQHDAALNALLAAWQSAQSVQARTLADQIAAAVSAGNPAALASLTVDTSPAADVLAQAMIAMAGQGAAQMVAEAAAQGVTIAAPTLDEQHLRDIARAVAQLMGSATADSAGREALRVWTPDQAGDAVARMVSDHMDGLSDAWPREQLGGALWAAQAHGRFRVLEDGPDATYTASEVLDVATCQPCREIDGHEFSSRTEAGAIYGSGGNISCLGRLRCRGVLLAVWSDQ